MRSPICELAMSLRFSICPQLACDYAQLQYDPDAKCRYLLVPQQTMYWLDEHPGGSVGGACRHLECFWMIHHLLRARQEIWDHGGVSQELAELWGDAIALIPEWPGFQRLDLDRATRALIEKHAEEGPAFLQEMLAGKSIRVDAMNALPAPDGGPRDESRGSYMESPPGNLPPPGKSGSLGCCGFGFGSGKLPGAIEKS